MKLEEQLERDRALRDAAWEVVADDVNWLQADLEHRSVSGRVIDTVAGKAKNFAGQSLDQARRNKLAIAAVAAGVAMWLARKPLARASRGIWAELSKRRADRQSMNSEEQEA